MKGKSLKSEEVIKTEEKIRDAARKVFTRKGFAGTRTRDIAEEAGINLALLNYYFRSKQLLFDQVMLEKMQQFFGTLMPVLNNVETSLESKIEEIASRYISLLSTNPDLPLFVLGEIGRNPARFVKELPVKQLVEKSSFMSQLKAQRKDINPLHFLFNILSLTVFPFIAKPVFQNAGLLNEKAFNKLMAERVELIPAWINKMLKMK
jgi:AcrR family transcriptional regulator